MKECTDDLLSDIRARLGNSAFLTRLRKQNRVSPEKRCERWLLRVGPRCISYLIKNSAFRGWIDRRCLDYRLEMNCIKVVNLPPMYKGIRLLHLSDCHVCSIPDHGHRLFQLVSKLDADLCVITGDFGDPACAINEEIIRFIRKLASAIRLKEGTYAILGNHDHMELVPYLESAGIRVLLNESVFVSREGKRLWIAGVDDSHHFRTHDLNKALATVPEGDFTILLSHSPELIQESAERGIDLYLCGHCHGGQICLPTGVTVAANARCKREYISGAWSYKKMKGYTSRGTGSSGAPIRINCPPEVTIHQLV